MVISGKQEPAVDGSIIVDVEIDVGDVGSAVVGCEDVTRMPAATADVECLVTSGTRTREALGGATLKIKRGAAVRPLRSRAAAPILVAPYRLRQRGIVVSRPESPCFYHFNWTCNWRKSKWLFLTI